MSTAPQHPGDPVPGAAPSIVHSVLQVAGGRPQVAVVTFDSAGGWSELRCDNSDRIDSCPNPTRQAGSVPSSMHAELWRLAISSEVRVLEPWYGFRGGVTPPDVHTVTVTVIANERRWQVAWDARASVPTILGRLDCRLRGARGALILCAT